MKLFGVQALGELLSTCEIGNEEEGIVSHLIDDACFVEAAREPMVTIEVDLQAKRRPRRHPDVTQTKALVDEVKVIMQALAYGRLQGCVMRLLVMPGAKRCAGLHCRKDMDQTGMLSAFLDDVLDSLFLAERFVTANEFDLEARFASQALRIAAYIIA